MIVSVPLIVPVVLGVKVRLMLHDVPGASVVPQVVLPTANPVLGVNVPMVSDEGAALASDIVMTLAALVLPTAVSGNFKLVGE